VFEWLKKKEKTVGEVLEQYQAVLMKYPIEILDISMLPLPKIQMKQVLKGLYAKEKRIDFQKYLENGFFYLSQFQEGVGDKPIDAKLSDGDVKENLDADLAKLERHSLWLKLQLAELDVLSVEWNQFKTQLGSNRQV
jgi:hypothetical protein